VVADDPDHERNENGEKRNAAVAHDASCELVWRQQLFAAAFVHGKIHGACEPFDWSAMERRSSRRISLIRFRSPAKLSSTSARPGFVTATRTIDRSPDASRFREAAVTPFVRLFELPRSRPLSRRQRHDRQGADMDGSRKNRCSAENAIPIPDHISFR
jgi:hypothetical protein